MLRFFSLIYFFFAVTNISAESATSCTEHQCIAVVDAGSTGSRAHIFTYDLDETNTPIQIKEIWSKKITPGLATIEATTSRIDAYLTLLLTDAPYQNIPVYFYATGGMRLIPQTKQKIYYKEIQNWFSGHAAWQLVDAKTIPGNDEALYDWLAVNYHIGALKSSATRPVGVMDIGGASVQIVFPMPRNEGISKDSQVELDLYGKRINLFVHSFLGLGQNEVTHQLLDTYSCFAENYPLPGGNSGKGDAPSCQREASSLINRVHKVKSEIQPALANTRVDMWYAIGGLANVVESAPFQFKNNQITNRDLIQQANIRVCHQPWENLSAEFPDNEYIESFCLLPSFYHALMVDGYGITAEQPINYIATAKNLDWTLGVVLHH